MKELKKMAVREVVLLGNPALRERSEEFKSFGEELTTVVKDLRDTLIHLQEKKEIGRALAAPQIGCQRRVIYCNLPEEEVVMVNPEIIWRSQEKFQVWDSCFSFDIAFFVRVSRHRSIKVKYWSESGEENIRTFDDDLSELFQHEIDHLEGILATDLLTDNKNIIMREEWEKRHK